MSIKELDRLTILSRVLEKRQTIRKAAAELSLSERQVKRLLKRLRNEGAEGLISKKIGKAGNHCLSEEVKTKAIRLIREKYEDFGPTLAHEYLTEKEGIKIGVSTLRHLMIREGIWQAGRRKRCRSYQLRQRRECIGELIQVDGSPHYWFEDRSEPCSLLVYIDDATSRIMHGHFAKSESLESYFEATRSYIEQHGRPRAFYTDKHSVFRVNQESVNGHGITQFGRAMQELDIELICANSPQAKGRVERRHRDLQDRLIKAMRLRKISTISEANAYLPEFIEDFNQRFAKTPQSTDNAHRNLLAHQDLKGILTKQSVRRLSKDLIVQYNNVIYQIHSLESRRLSNKDVVVRELDGQITFEYQGKPLQATPYHQIQYRPVIASRKEILHHHLESKKQHKPSKRHPWKCKRSGFGSARICAL